LLRSNRLRKKAKVTPPAPAPPGPTRSLANLATYLGADDYPAEALRDSHEGTVAFQLDVGADGRVSACRVTSTSGSAALDAATCRLMTERPRFSPARDASGRAVPDRVSARITWSLPEPAPTPQPEPPR
jgi:periplasmic protein TonB